MMNSQLLSGLYGAPPRHLAHTPPDARQLSPLHPGAADLGAASPGSYAHIAMLAPPGTLDRRYALAQALTALALDGELIALAPKDKGGMRIAKELKAFGCAVLESSKNHFRFCAVKRPKALLATQEALIAGGPQSVEAIGLWSQPGVFSWDRMDPGSTLLAARLPPLHGHGADLGCGIGALSLVALQSPDVMQLDLIDIDRRAIHAAQRNVTDPRAHFHWRDLTSGDARSNLLDFVVMNPPFHSGAQEDKSLGQAFIRRAARMLRPGGVCWLVANRHLPYETALAETFTSVRLDHEADGYKVLEARK
jgi:16S rRNA (guanine1207-N2)-methyltransferase